MSRAPQRAPLTRDRIVRAAVALADDNGIEAVSMRRLAKDLGVSPADAAVEALDVSLDELLEVPRSAWAA